eukprot:751523-Hanusia_phi.AAC.3
MPSVADRKEGKEAMQMQMPERDETWRIYHMPIETFFSDTYIMSSKFRISFVKNFRVFNMDSENEEEYTSLLKVVELNKCIRESQASYLTRTLICHLNKLHDCGQNHGRLRLDNVYIKTTGENRGSMLVGTEKDNSASIRRNRCCCVSEQSKNSSCSPSSDVWSIGCLLIQMLSGRVCCTGASQDCLGNPCERPSLSALFSHEFLSCGDASCQLDLCVELDDIPLLVKQARSTRLPCSPEIPRLRFCCSSADEVVWDAAPCMRSRNRSVDETTIAKDRVEPPPEATGSVPMKRTDPLPQQNEEFSWRRAQMQHSLAGISCTEPPKSPKILTACAYNHTQQVVNIPKR